MAQGRNHHLHAKHILALVSLIYWVLNSILDRVLIVTLTNRLDFMITAQKSH